MTMKRGKPLKETFKTEKGTAREGDNDAFFASVRQTQQELSALGNPGCWDNALTPLSPPAVCVCGYISVCAYGTLSVSIFLDSSESGMM